jgi:hypothetical protein
MRWLIAFLTLALTVLTSACGGGSGQEPARAAEAPPAETVFDPMTSQIDKAREAAETLPQERKDGLDQAIDGDSH